MLIQHGLLAKHPSCASEMLIGVSFKQVLSMSRLGGAAAAAPLIGGADMPHEVLPFFFNASFDKAFLLYIVFLMSRCRTGTGWQRRSSKWRSCWRKTWARRCSTCKGRACASCPSPSPPRFPPPPASLPSPVPSPLPAPPPTGTSSRSPTLEPATARLLQPSRPTPQWPTSAPPPRNASSSPKPDLRLHHETEEDDEKNLNLEK